MRNKTEKTIREIIDHPKNARWQTFYECPSESREDTSYIVATNKSEEWGCSCPRWIFKREDCKHIRRVQLFLVFANERGSKVAPVEVKQMSQKTQKAVSRFSLVDV